MRNNLSTLKKIVIKIGSEAIVDGPNGLKKEAIQQICEDVQFLLEKDIEVVLISSGAIGLGRHFLKPEKREAIDFLQAASSLGQPRLFQKYLEGFQKLKKNCAQILLTHEDFKNRKRYLNAKNTLLKLLENKIVPILNENDTVSFNEITVGDNDHLAAITAQMLEVDLMLLISKTDGLYDKSPEYADAKPIREVIFGEKLKIKTSSKSLLGRGGMHSKLLAVNKATEHGIKAIIAGSNFSHAIRRALVEETGTLFLEKKESKTKLKKKWMATTVKHGCQIIVDEGCKEALLKNRSLLPSGIKKIKGIFSRGDSIEIAHKKEILAVGIVEYSSKEIEKIKGCKSSEIMSRLGFILKDEVIHRNNLILKEKLK